jgi:hypothetical protein
MPAGSPGSRLSGSTRATTVPAKIQNAIQKIAQTAAMVITARSVPRVVVIGSLRPILDPDQPFSGQSIVLNYEMKRASTSGWRRNCREGVGDGRDCRLGTSAAHLA